MARTLFSPPVRSRNRAQFPHFLADSAFRTYVLSLAKKYRANIPRFASICLLSPRYPYLDRFESPIFTATLYNEQRIPCLSLSLSLPTRSASQFTLDLTGKTSFRASIVATSERYKTVFGARIIRPSSPQLFAATSKLFKSRRKEKIIEPRRRRDTEVERHGQEVKGGKKRARNIARTFLCCCQRLSSTLRFVVSAIQRLYTSRPLLREERSSQPRLSRNRRVQSQTSVVVPISA